MSSSGTTVTAFAAIPAEAFIVERLRLISGKVRARHADRTGAASSADLKRQMAGPGLGGSLLVRAGVRVGLGRDGGAGTLRVPRLLGNVVGCL